MKKLHILLPLAAILLASACKKKDPVAAVPEPAPPKVNTKSRFPQDSTSFTINGKRYTNAFEGAASRGNGNRGVNLRLSATDGEWSLSGTGSNYWVGEADSVQYSSHSKTMLEHDEGAIIVSFIKKYKRENALKLGSTYYPRNGDKFYTLGDYNYAVDFTRGGREEGVAIELGVNKQKYTSYSQLSMNAKSKLTAESHRNSKFKILKMEEIKGTDLIILEATFEADLFDKNENALRVTEGFFRITTPKTGERIDSFTLLYLNL